MNKKYSILASKDIILSLKNLAKEKENVRRKLGMTATKLAVTADKLAVTAKEKENVRRKLVITAKEKEDVRQKLAVVAKQLASTAKEIALSNKYARSLIEASLDPLVTISPKGKITDVNEATINVTGVSRVNLIDTDFSKYFTEPKKAFAGYKKVFREGSVTDYPLTIRSRMGKLTSVLYNASVYKDDKGNVLGVFAAARDVTETKKASGLLVIAAKKLAITAKEKEDVRQKLVITAKEKEGVRRKLVVIANKLKRSYETLEHKVFERTKDLEMSRAKEEAILLSIGDGLIVTDEKGNIIIINKIAEKLLDVKRKDVIGKLFSVVTFLMDEKGTYIPLEKHPISMALSGSTTANSSKTYYSIRKDKTKFPISIVATPVILLDKVIGTIKIFRDITDEQEIDKAKTEFVSLASHQLRTPLSAVNWYAEMLLAGDAGELNLKQKKYLDEVYHSNQRMVELVNALLDVSSLELGTFVIEPEPTDIKKLTQSTIDEQRPQINAKKLELSFLFGENIPIMQVDPKLLRMIVQNILSNAVKYTPEGGKIKLSIVITDKKNILFQISDTGYGIPMNQQHKIFTKLFRADNVRDKDTNGTGLGLYIVKLVVENSGGRIWFKSSGAKGNKGTTFYVTLPSVGMKKSDHSRLVQGVIK